MDDDGALVTNATAGGGSSSYQRVGFDAHGANRDVRRFHSFNFFARNDPTSSAPFSGSNRRWLAVVDGSTKKILYNMILPNSFSPLPVSDVTEIRAAVNMAELPDPVEDFAAWATARIPEEALRGENVDADGDGMVNLLEYAYGSDPTTRDAQKGPRVAFENGNPVLYFQRSTGAQVTPLVVLGGESPNSTGVIDISGIEEPEESAEGVQSVRVPFGRGQGERFFLRLSTSTLGK